MNSWKEINPRARIAGVATLAVAVAVLAIAWWLGSPLFISNTVNETFPAAAPAMPKADAMTGTDAMVAGDAVAETDAMVKSDAPVALSVGSFTEVDSIHKGAGNATIFELPDGKRVLRFEDFNVTNGPDLFVYLSGHAQPRSAGELHGQGDYDLGRLKGNVGSQNYELPADLDLSKFKSVVIYCKQFSVVFSTATLDAS